MKKKNKNEKPKSDNLLGRTQEEVDAINHTMYDPGEQHLDLTKAEKLRTTALLMAINYVRETICSDAELYRAMRQDGKQFIAASVPWIVGCSVDFEDFLLGRYSNRNVALVKRGAEAERANEAGRSEPASEEAPSVDAVDPQAGSTTS